jgi:hypothetical protein
MPILLAPFHNHLTIRSRRQLPLDIRLGRHLDDRNTVRRRKRPLGRPRLLRAMHRPRRRIVVGPTPPTRRLDRGPSHQRPVLVYHHIPLTTPLRSETIPAPRRAVQICLRLLHPVLFLHDEHGTPGLQELVPSDLRDEAREEGVGACPGAPQTGRWEAEEGGVGLDGRETWPVRRDMHRTPYLVVLRLLFFWQNITDLAFKREMHARRLNRPMHVLAIVRKHGTRVEREQCLEPRHPRGQRRQRARGRTDS